MMSDRLKRGIVIWGTAVVCVIACDRASVVSAPETYFPSQQEADTTGGGTGATTGGTTGGAQTVSVSLTANGVSDHLVLPQGSSATLDWASTNATSCAMSSRPGSSGSPQAVDWGSSLSGTHAVTPSDETVYSIACTNGTSSATASVDIFVALPCNGNGKTLIHSLTSRIVNNAPNQLMQYELSYVDCSGNPAPFPDAPVWFDYNAYQVSDVVSLDYTITTADGAVNVSGSLRPVWGEDLFGHTGSNYFHFLTDKSIGIPAGVTTFKFTVDMSDSESHLVQPSLFRPAPPREVINTFLRIGSSEPDVAPVTFVNQ